MGKVYVVTGANKGLGFSIVKQLCELKGPDDTVYLTSRNVSFGMYAEARLKQIGLAPTFHQLDLLEITFIKAFVDLIKEKHGGIDVLVNNAAVARSRMPNIPVWNNYSGTLSLTEHLLPLMKKNGRVVNVGCRSGPRVFTRISDAHKKSFADPNLTIEGLTALMDKYVASYKAGTVKQDGYVPNTGYGMSKMAVMRLTKLQQIKFDKENAGMGVIFSTCCPGFICTDLSGLRGPVKPDDGAQVVVKLATLPADFNGMKGEFWEGHEIVEWLDKQYWKEKWTRGKAGYC